MIPIDNIKIVTNISKKIGVPSDQVYTMLIVLLGIPFSIINYIIKSPKIRIIYSLILGFLFQFLVYELGIVHIIITSIITYYFVKFYGRKKSAFYITFITLFYLGTLHLYRLIYYYGRWDIRDPTSIYMMTLCKFCSFAFSFEDGEKNDKDIYNNTHKKYKIKELPSFLEFLSYIYFYPTAIVGPSFDFIDFHNFIYLNKPYSNMNFVNNLIYGFLNIIVGFLFIGFYGSFNYKFLPDYMSTEKFKSENLIYKLFYINISSFFTKCKYHGAWSYNYGILILSGLPYSEEEITNEKNNKKEVIKNYNIGNPGSFYIVETSYNPRDIIINWDRSVHLWLKYNVLLRLISVDNKYLKNNFSLSSFITFICSSIWHGFYKCYYYFFISFYFLQQSSEILNKIGFYNVLNKSNFCFKILCSIIIQSIINSVSDIFFILKEELVIKYLKNVYYFPFISVILLYLICQFMMINFKNKKNKIQ